MTEAKTGGSYYLGIHGGGSTVPSASSLISLSLLEKTNPHVFKKLASESTKWLSSALILLEKDPYMKVKFGSNLLEGAVALSEILKKDAEERHFKARLEEASRVFNLQELEYGLHGKLPVAKKNELYQLSASGRFIVQNANLGKALFRN